MSSTKSSKTATTATATTATAQTAQGAAMKTARDSKKTRAIAAAFTNAFRSVALGIVKKQAYAEHTHWTHTHEAAEARVWDLADHSRYDWHTNAQGRKVYDNGDSVARDLRDATLEDVYAIASKELGLDVLVLQARYEHLNNGQQRMNLGNRIRKVRTAKAAA